jgi:putative acetyltransferase
MLINIKRVDNNHPDFVSLTNRLDAELTKRYGTKQSAYDKHNIIDHINTSVVGYIGERPVACGCFKVFDNETVEIKRIYVVDDCRRNGLSVIILQALEKWGLELEYTNAILETGKGQPEAIGLYKKCGYQVTENYGPYKDFENSVCMKKVLIKQMGCL